MESNNNNGHPGPNPNHSIDYDSWVNSLGSIQDSIFQNTPMTSHILQHTSFNNVPANGPQAPLIFQPQVHDNNIFYDSPERFYRDIINESPIITRTPQVGRTPLRNMNINFSTPNFLKNIDAYNMFGSATKGLTPLKNQRQFHPNGIFQSPNDNKENSDTHQHNSSTNLNSSPTTIKMGSSAIKGESDENAPKTIPASPTPGSKSSASDFTQNIPIPKMGCFKKTPEPESKTKTSKTGTTSNFQIIMTDVNSFANNTKPTRRKKKLGRSSTVTNPSKTTITKKSSLKRTLSQPQSKLEKVVATPAATLETLTVPIAVPTGTTPLLNRHPQATPVQYRTQNQSFPYVTQGTPGMHQSTPVYPQDMKMIQQQQPQSQMVMMQAGRQGNQHHSHPQMHPHMMQGMPYVHPSPQPHHHHHRHLQPPPPPPAQQQQQQPQQQPQQPHQPVTSLSQSHTRPAQATSSEQVPVDNLFNNKALGHSGNIMNMESDRYF